MHTSFGITFNITFQKINLPLLFLYNVPKIKGVYISDNYELLSITGNKKEVAEIIANEISFLTVFDLANHQLIIDKITPKEIFVEVKVIDENTGECVYNAIWPKEEIRFSVKEWQFSE